MLVITGTGRSGTSVVAEICRRCGFDPGGHWDESVNAGREDRAVVKINRAIYDGRLSREQTQEAIRKLDRPVVKDPRFVRFGPRIIATWHEARSDLRVLLVLRDLDSAVRSMLKDPERFMSGRLALDRDPKAAAAQLRQQIAWFQQACRSYDIPLASVRFPDFISKPLPLYRALQKFGQLDIPRDIFMSSHASVCDWNKVHVKP